MDFAINQAKASVFADDLRLIAKELAEVEADLDDVASAINSNEEDFMSRHDVGENVSLAAAAVKQHAENLEKIAKAVEVTADKAVTHEKRAVNYINSGSL